MVGGIGVNSANEIGVAQRLAARMAAKTDIRDVRLLRTSAEIIRIPVENPFLAYDFNSESTVEHEPGSESFVVRGTYRLSIRSVAAPAVEGDSTSDSAIPVANIEFEHAALFVIEMGGEEPPKDEELNAYAVTTGQFALYPYVREYISDVTCRLGLPALTVGVLRMPFKNSADE